jgi:hypothetical protein
VLYLHRGNPGVCGRQCRSAQCDTGNVFEHEQILKTFVTGKQTIVDQAACTEGLDEEQWVLINTETELTQAQSILFTIMPFVYRIAKSHCIADLPSISTPNLDSSFLCCQPPPIYPCITNQVRWVHDRGARLRPDCWLTASLQDLAKPSLHNTALRTLQPISVVSTTNHRPPNGFIASNCLLLPVTFLRKSIL